MRMTILAGLALALLAAGCGSDDADGDGGSSGGEKAALSGPVTYERGGGLKGRRDRLVVQPDGSATLTVRDRAEVGDAERQGARPRSRTISTRPTSARCPRTRRRSGRRPTRSATA